MDVILVYNGLGNQMSQYALYLSKKSMGQHVRCIFQDTGHNGIELDKVFGIPTKMNFWDWGLKTLCMQKKQDYFHPSFFGKVLTRCGVRLFIEGKHSVYPFVLKGARGITFYVGGWHHPDYFKRIDPKIRETYRFPAFSEDQNLEVLNEAQNSHAVAIHIRRGDYLDCENYKALGMVCTEIYYRNAISYMENRIGAKIRFYVFSNDMQWSRRFMEGKDCVFVDWNEGKNSWKDMSLMSQFGNLIIPNSTFSWWSAYLGNRNKTVCRPPFFVNNETVPGFYLENWIEISNK